MADNLEVLIARADLNKDGKLSESELAFLFFLGLKCGASPQAKGMPDAQLKEFAEAEGKKIVGKYNDPPSIGQFQSDFPKTDFGEMVIKNQALSAMESSFDEIAGQFGDVQDMQTYIKPRVLACRR